MLQMDRSSDTRPHKYERDRTQILNAEAWVLWLRHEDRATGSDLATRADLALILFARYAAETQHGFRLRSGNAF
jgi:hypothetical protein